jgi:hypothetical protein
VQNPSHKSRRLGSRLSFNVRQDVNRKNTVRSIREAWVAVLVCASLTAVISLLSLVGISFGQSSLAGQLDAGLIGGLSYGISRANRIWAMVMFVYYLGGKI